MADQKTASLHTAASETVTLSTTPGYESVRVLWGLAGFAGEVAPRCPWGYDLGGWPLRGWSSAWETSIPRCVSCRARWRYWCAPGSVEAVSGVRHGNPQVCECLPILRRAGVGRAPGCRRRLAGGTCADRFGGSGPRRSTDVTRDADHPRHRLPQQVDLAARPHGQVRHGVAGGIEADVGGDEVGDGFGFDLGLAAAAEAGCVVGEAVLMVGADVAELVGKGLGGLGWFDVVEYPDDAVGVVGVSVGAVAGSAFDPVPIGRDEVDEVVPEAVGRVAVQ